MTQHFDPGLQPERTELAWRRTCLALGVGSIVAMRLLPAAFGHALWVLAGIAGLIATICIWVTARSRFEHGVQAITAGGAHARLADGHLLLALACFAIVIGLSSLTVVLSASSTDGL